MWKTSARSRLKLARSERFAYDADGEGRGRAFKKKSLKVTQERIYLDEIGLERWTAPGDHCCFLWAGSVSEGEASRRSKPAPICRAT